MCGGHRPHHHAGQVRRPEPGRAQATRGRRYQGAAVPQGRHGRRVQELHGAVRRHQFQESEVEKGLHGLRGLPQGPEPLVPFHRSPVRPLHAVGQALIGAASGKKPRPGGVFCSNGVRCSLVVRAATPVSRHSGRGSCRR